eukprot:13519797-Alexandrium_andersonii.AAC.1
MLVLVHRILFTLVLVPAAVVLFTVCCYLSDWLRACPGYVQPGSIPIKPTLLRAIRAGGVVGCIGGSVG